MKDEIFSKPGSVFDGKNLKEILEIIKDWPVHNPELEKAKKRFEEPGFKEALYKAFGRIK